MANNADPLQGSLFEDSHEASILSKASISTPPVQEEDLSDKELTQDAKKRPRKRKKTETEPKSSISSKSTESTATHETDLPAWHHHSLVEIDQLTPVLRHYVELKKESPERILLYRLGDFFECFFEDAIKLSQLLELTLTGKEAGKALGRVPMAGVPHHAVERYCSELINKGLSVALCDQLESTPSKGALLKRGITRILTPGTVIEEGMLQARRNNWLVALVREAINGTESCTYGLARADVSTGEFLVTEIKESELLTQELTKIEASEIILGESEPYVTKAWCPEHIQLTKIPKTPFNRPEAECSLKRYFKIKTINGLGLQEFPLALRAAGGLVAYLGKTKPMNYDQQNEDFVKQIPLEFPKITLQNEQLILDSQTRRNLEITSTQRDNQFQGSLLWAIDRTLTSMGARCLRRWIEAPLINALEIRARQAVINQLVETRSLRQGIRNLLRAMSDLERLAGRAGAGQAGARDLLAIADGIERLPLLTAKLKQLNIEGPKWTSDLLNIDPKLIELAVTIKEQLFKNPPLSLTEGGLIHDGIDPLLDGIRNQIDDQEAWLKGQESLERKLSKNINLRLQYHRTFGYFLSVSKAKAGEVPEHWIRRQTLTNEERFITPDLKAREGKIFQIKARAAQREYELFCILRDKVGNQARGIRKAARAVAGLDALAGLAELAATCSYCQPTILTNKNENIMRSIELKDCRHPVVEQMLAGQSFKPNDINLGNGTDLIILTGPNASGKSCYLRQVGLIQLLAQIGSWVPAKKASLSVADRICTRVGAVDDLASGQSTFMVEMAETAFILNQATTDSLVLLDEIGRGTATFDGLSIAWAVSECLAKEIKSRTIFATHYHELNTLSDTLENISNYQVLVQETEEELLFLHKVAPGGASQSYGIEAARLAGVRQDVVKRAREVLTRLENKN